MSRDQRRRDEKTLKLVADTLAQAQRLTARGRIAYDEDEMLRLAAEAVVSRLGEAVKRLSDDFKAQQPNTPWRNIAGIRDIVVHEYHRIDYDTVWETLTEDMPELAGELRGVLPTPTPPRRRSRTGAKDPARVTQCGYAMPRAKATCILKGGHRGAHRSK